MIILLTLWYVADAVSLLGLSMHAERDQLHARQKGGASHAGKHGPW
jgi:hypothetical protein